MPGAYSTDLRERVLVAIEAGEPADAVADEFMVGRSSVYRWMAAARDEGRREPKPMGRGPKPIIRTESMQGCGVHCATAALAPSSFAGRNPE